MAFQDAVDDKYKTLSERENEIRQLKQSQRDKERDIEKANQMLLNAEESIDVSC